MTYPEAEALIKEIKNLKYKCNEWEEQFIQSISRQSTFTEKQSKCLIRIYEKATGGGQYEKRIVI